MDGDARESGAGIEESGRDGLILSRGSPPARGFGGDAPLFRPGRGNRKGTRGGGWAGPGRGCGWRPSLGRGSVQMGHGSSGGEACSFFFLFL